MDWEATERQRLRELAEHDARMEARRGQRRSELRRTHRRRRAVAVALVSLLAVMLAGAWSLRSDTAQAPARKGTARPAAHASQRRAARALPAHVRLPAQLRGVHVSLYAAGQAATMRRLFALAGAGPHALNALEIDVKDEAGRVGFVSGVPALARRTGAAGRFYDARALVRQAHRRGIYVIGRVVCFEDPVLATHAPRLAIRTRAGGIWTNRAGLGWVNEYSPAVSAYLVGLARAAASAGFDEVQFDYVRFPTDGNVSDAVWRGKRHEPFRATLRRLLAAARATLHPLGVRLSADVFGLAANRDLGIGQNVRALAPLLDAVSPMAYPSHYGPGEYGLANPDDDPYDTVAHTMADFRDATAASPRTQIRPWLQDFSLGRSYSLADVRAQIRAALGGGARGFLLWNPSSIYTSAAFGP